jgi:tripartite-type tricarboxylate transporter receptor subunit TctC
MSATHARRVLGRAAPAGLASLAAIGTTPAPAQTASRYPDKPITWVVGYPPGGRTDVITAVEVHSVSRE